MEQWKKKKQTNDVMEQWNYNDGGRPNNASILFQVLDDWCSTYFQMLFFSS